MSPSSRYRVRWWQLWRVALAVPLALAFIILTLLAKVTEEVQRPG